MEGVMGYGMRELSERFGVNGKRLRKECQLRNPNEEMAEYMRDEFSISLALKAMVENIMRLSAEVEMLKYEKVALGKRVDEVVDYIYRESDEMEEGLKKTLPGKSLSMYNGGEKK